MPDRQKPHSQKRPRIACPGCGKDVARGAYYPQLGHMIRTHKTPQGAICRTLFADTTGPANAGGGGRDG